MTGQRKSRFWAVGSAQGGWWRLWLGWLWWGQIAFWIPIGVVREPLERAMPGHSLWPLFAMVSGYGAAFLLIEHFTNYRWRLLPGYRRIWLSAAAIFAASSLGFVLLFLAPSWADIASADSFTDVLLAPNWAGAGAMPVWSCWRFRSAAGVSARSGECSRWCPPPWSFTGSPLPPSGLPARGLPPRPGKATSAARRWRQWCWCDSFVGSSTSTTIIPAGHSCDSSRSCSPFLVGSPSPRCGPKRQNGPSK